MRGLLAPLLQALVGSALAMSGRPGQAALQRLLVGVLGLLAAVLLGGFAVVLLVFGGLMWLLPPSFSMVEVSLLAALVLAALAGVLWLVSTAGHAPSQLLEDLFEPDYPSPVTHFGRSAKKVLASFQRGWHGS